MGVWGTEPTDNWIGLPSELDWTPEMKNGRAHFGTEPTLRLPSFRAILCGVESTGFAGIAPQIMAQAHSSLRLLQTASNMRMRELWLVFHETRKNDASIRETSKWIERAFSHLQ